MTVHSANFRGRFADTSIGAESGPSPGERYLDVLGRRIEVVEVRLQPHGGRRHVVVRVPWLSTGHSIVQEWVPKVWDRMIAVGPLVDEVAPA